MTDNDPADTLRKSRSRIYNKTHPLLEDDPVAFNMESLERQLASIAKTEGTFRRASEQYHEETVDEMPPTEEQEALQNFEDNVERTTALIRKLMSIKQIHQDSSNFRDDIDGLEVTFAKILREITCRSSGTHQLL